MPWTEFATAGQPFTYTIAITNVSQTSIQNVIVVVKTPKGTTYRDSDLDAGQRWLTGGFSPGQPGEISWLTQEAIAPGDEAVIKLVVNVPPEAGMQLINESYFVTTLDDFDAAVVSGPPIETQVLMPPTPTPLPTVTPSPTALATIASRATTTAPTAISKAESQPIPVDMPVLAPTVVSRTDAAQTASVPTSVMVVIGLVLLTIVAGLIWFLKR
jgi:uncharacterized repeat protein (TIGR01451 family)